jgi:hypothetical protein
MPTPSQVAGRAQNPPSERHYVGTVSTASNPATVTLNPGGATTKASALDGRTYPVGARVLVLVTQFGNWIISGAAAAAAPPSYTWTDFSSSFTITGSVANPTLGASTFGAQHATVDKIVFYQFAFAVAAGFVPGSGQYHFNVPFPVAGNLSTPVGSVWISDADVGYDVGSMFFISTSAMRIVTTKAGQLSSAGPGTPWAAGDTIRASIVYRRA